MIYILTVGKNPLPVAVAALHFLAKDGPDAEFNLVHSSKSKKESGRIRKLLEGKQARKIREHCVRDAGDSVAVYRTIADIARKADGTIHFHYSGGTSAMAAHGMFAVKEHAPSAVTSYLPLDKNVVVTEGVQGMESDDLRRHVNLTFEELARLHDYVRCEVGEHGMPILPVTDRLTGLVEKWGAAKEFKVDPISNEKRTAVKEYASHDFRTGNRMLAGELNAAYGQDLWKDDGRGWTATLSTATGEFWDTQHFFPKNGWFELKALAALRAALGKESRWSPDIVLAKHFAHERIVKSLTATFEVDVAAVFGYQLVLVSCCTTAREDVTKEKAFEALHRAHQLGGSGATAIVITQTDRAKAVEQSLHWDIGLDPEAKNKPLEIWGREKAENLEVAFEEYIGRL